MFANFGLKKILNGKMNITTKRFFGEYINSHLSLFGATYLWLEASPQGWKFVRASKIFQSQSYLSVLSAVGKI